MTGSVTVLTAERMLEIEASSVVSGEVVGADLILETRGGTPIDAGNVRGAEVIHHGSNANTVRPAAPLVYWIGEATPVNAKAWDLQLRENI